jgi:hypothetical protein
VINVDEIARSSGRICVVIQYDERRERRIRRAGGEEVDEDRACVGGDAGGCVSGVAEGLVDDHECQAECHKMGK